MIKILWRTLILLLAAALVAGGIYLFAENGGISGLSIGGLSAEAGRDGFSAGEMGERPEGRRSDGGQLPPQGDRIRRQGGHDSEMGFSLAGLGGVGLQLGKVALITGVVVAIQAFGRWFKRRRKSDGAVAV